MRAEPVVEPASLRERVAGHVDRVRRYATWVQYVAVGLLSVTLVALTLGIVSEALRLQWWIVIVLALILLGTLGIATLARRLARFAHLIVRVFGK